MAITATDGTLVHDTLVSFDEDHADTKPKLVIRYDQEIPEEHISQLKRDKIDTINTPSGEMLRVATIPLVLVDKWKREGFDIDKEPIRDILKRLRKEHLDAFITTNKRI